MGLVNKIVEFVSGVKAEKSTSRSTHYYIYPRTKDNKRTGQTLCVLLHDGKIFHGMSTCSKDDQFCKDTGRKIALIRAQSSVQRYEARKLKGLE